jgi:hypothetical protein
MKKALAALGILLVALAGYAFVLNPAVGANLVLILTDGTNTITGVQKLTVTGGTVGGAGRNATLTVTGGATFANPTATIGTSAVNGVASTALRSDAAPAIPQCSASTFGACKVDGTTITASGGVISSTGGTAPVVFVGTVAGTNTYTSTASPAYSANTAYNMFCGFFANANSGDSTLNLTSIGALHIYQQTTAGLALLVGGEIAAGTSHCLQLDSTATKWTLQAPVFGNVNLLSTASANTNVTASQWANGDTFIVTATSQTITLPAATSMSPKGGVVIETIPGISVSLVPNAADGINGGTINTAATIQPNTISAVTTSGSSGTGAINTNLGTAPVPLSISYSPGINPNNIPIFRANASRTVTGIVCRPEVAAGGAATISVVKAASGTALSAGTVLHSGSFNANGTAATDQALTVTTSSLASGDTVGITTTGTTVWTSSGVATGVCTVYIQ